MYVVGVGQKSLIILQPGAWLGIPEARPFSQAVRVTRVRTLRVRGVGEGLLVAHGV